ncbi:hypothetical protein ABPG72_000728 [Tetrahymena utriculariae]
MQSELIQYQKGNYQNAQFINTDQFIIDDEFNYEPSNMNQTEQYQESDNDMFQISNQPNNKLKQINKVNKKRGRGRPRKGQANNQLENIDSMDYTQMFSQSVQQLGTSGKQNTYNRKFPKDHLKQNMIKLESKVLRLFHEIQSLFGSTNQLNDQNEDDRVDQPFYQQYEIQKRLDWNTVSSETGYSNSSILFRIYSFIGDQIKNPSDPYGQEFISLSVENFIVTFFLDKAIDQNQYQFQDLIENNLNHNPNLRFYQLALDDLCQILLSEISISIYSDQVLAQVSQYIKILKQLSNFIPNNNYNQSILPLKSYSYNVLVESQKQIDVILPFQMQNYNFELIDHSQIEIIRYFNLQWTTLIEQKFKYHGIYIQYYV